MKKNSRIFCLLLAAILAVGLLSACSGASSAASSAPSAPSTPAAAPSYTSSGSAEMASKNVEGGGARDQISTTSAPQAPPTPGNPVTILPDGALQKSPDLKLIRTAYLTMETEEFDKAQLSLDTLVFKFGGYYEYAEVRGGEYTKRGDRSPRREARYGAYTVRVPSAYFSDFLKESGEIALVVASSQNAQDVSEQYFDLEARLKTLRTKQERLSSLLMKAEKMEDIIQLEHSLSDVSYEIESYTSTLKSLSSQIDYSSVRINLNETLEDKDEPVEGESFLSRISKAFKNGFRAFFGAAGDLLVLAAYLLPVLLLLAAVLFLALFLRRRWRKKQGPPAGPTPPPAE